MSSGTTESRLGRPLSAETDRAVRAATLALLDEVGYAGLRVQDVATRAGVGKAALYRRWPSKAALAMHHLIGDLAPRTYRDTGSLHADLREVSADFVARMANPRVRAVLPEIFADLLHEQVLQSVFEEACIRPEQDLVQRTAERAVERGELTAVPDVRWAHAQFSGPVFLWLYLLGGHGDAALIDRVADAVYATWINEGKKI
ncbi:TetR/AcrR family transcriptional regulator [Nocardia vaccinii]|uniref:TetR/AcrR family transcriptional regulator n=1 Tax=Nocardia vaccinii TaxID=1822 RepID=UPI0008365EFC|nr:TetR/AcrR family transcriptional regulator [Nocardia vaccinii]